MAWELRASERVFKRTVAEGTRDNCKRILHKSASLETARLHRQQVASRVSWKAVQWGELLLGRWGGVCTSFSCSPGLASHPLSHLILVQAIDPLDAKLHKAGDGIYCPIPPPAQLTQESHLSKCVFQTKNQTQRG